MNITSIDFFCSCSGHVAKFSFRDPFSRNPYVANGISGLDADEIVSSFYGKGSVTGNKFYSLSVRKREIVLKLAINPDFSQGETIQGLRNSLYRAISTSRTGQVQLIFNDGETPKAHVKGLVTKLEAGLFNELSEVQVTIKCLDPTLQALEPVEVDVSSFETRYPVIVDDHSNAPHGMKFVGRIIEYTPSITLSDSLAPDWNFKVVAGLIGEINGFVEGDEIHYSSEKYNRYLYVRRFGVDHHILDKVQAGSIWPIIFPGENSFVLSGPMEWVSISHYPTYWGV